MNIQRNVGIAAHIGAYSDAVEVSTEARWLITSGTPGLSSNGVLPEDFSSQAVLAWKNVIRMLPDADVGAQNVVKIMQYLIRRSDLDAYRPIRGQFLGEARPASMLSSVNNLVWPQC